jgi:hypothetical protein
MLPLEDVKLSLKEMEAWPDRTKADPRVSKIMNRHKRTIKENSRKFATSEGFEKWYKVFPKKKLPDRALQQWRSMNIDETLFGDIMLSTEALAKQVGDDQEKIKFLPNPDRWLRDGGWKDGDLEPYKKKVTESKERTCSFCDKVIEKTVLTSYRIGTQEFGKHGCQTCHDKLHMKRFQDGAEAKAAISVN